jgi:hypothetical protein
VAHLHWGLFGFDVSLPAPDEGEHGQRDNCPEFGLIRLAGELPMMPQDTGGPSWALALLPPGSVVDLDPLTPPPSRPPNLVASIPLCDSARLERSGVLLS